MEMELINERKVKLLMYLIIKRTITRYSGSLETFINKGMYNNPERYQFEGTIKWKNRTRER